MEIFGHRGAAGLVAENTLAGFRRAAQLGCHGIECDVWAVEGRLAVIHDITVDRTTNGHGTLDALGAEALRRLDTGAGPVPWVSELVPLVVQYPTLLWNIEIKDERSVPLLEREMETWPAPVVDRVLLSSFLPETLAPWARHNRSLALCGEPLTPALVEAARRLGCGSVHVAVDALDPAALPLADAAGLAVRAYTVNDPATALRLAGLGVRGVFTDRPDVLLDALNG